MPEDERIGEIMVKSPMAEVALPAKSARAPAIEDGWLRTGDLGRTTTKVISISSIARAT